MNETDTKKSLAGMCARARIRAKKPEIVLNVLIACEESQAECEAFRELGHNAFSCDIQPCREKGNPHWHIHGDVTPYLHGKTSFRTMAGDYCDVGRWDMIIAHPPCTYLCKLSSVWMHKNEDWWVSYNGQIISVNYERYYQLLKARSFFFECLNAKARYVAVENPQPMALAKLPRPSTYACPSWFGVKYTKKTLYWLRNLPPLMATLVHSNPKCYVTCSRGKYRSRTFPQLAKELARQWSEYAIDDMISNAPANDNHATPDKIIAVATPSDFTAPS